MKGPAEIQAENDALAAIAEAQRKASLRRLKQRIASYAFEQAHNGRVVRVVHINMAISEWASAERKRGGK